MPTLSITDQKILFTGGLSFVAGVLAASLFSSRKVSASPDSSVPIGPRLARPNINSLQPYRCARDDYEEGILLDANENSLGPVLGDGTSNELEVRG